MSFKPHNDLCTPPDTTTVQRYMDMQKFIYLLRTESLYFPSIVELQAIDPREGLVPMSEAYPDKQKFDKLLQPLRANIKVNCWHIGNHENMAMWNLYSGQVAIQTTIGDLKDAVLEDIHIGKIYYKDLDEKDEPYDYLKFMFIKNPAYEHEHELRLMRHNPWLDQWLKQPKKLNLLNKLNEHSRKIGVKVKLSQLIKQVYVSPTLSTEWHKANIEDLLTKYNLNNIEVKTISLLNNFRKG